MSHYKIDLFNGKLDENYIEEILQGRKITSFSFDYTHAQNKKSNFSRNGWLSSFCIDNGDVIHIVNETNITANIIDLQNNIQLCLKVARA